MKAEANNTRRNIRPAQAVVLCVDEADRDVISYWLAQAEIDTAVAASGYDAESLITPGVTRLLITDRVLPPWPGLPTFRQLKIANSTLRVAVIEDGIPDNRIIANITGADVLLPRPLKRSAVLEAANSSAVNAG
jgi:DNA-binding response OmpR family regulator